MYIINNKLTWSVLPAGVCPPPDSAQLRLLLIKTLAAASASPGAAGARVPGGAARVPGGAAAGVPGAAAGARVPGARVPGAAAGAPGAAAGAPGAPGARVPGAAARVPGAPGAPGAAARVPGGGTAAAARVPGGGTAAAARVHYRPVNSPGRRGDMVTRSLLLGGPSAVGHVSPRARRTGTIRSVSNRRAPDDPGLLQGFVWFFFYVTVSLTDDR